MAWPRPAATSPQSPAITSSPNRLRSSARSAFCSSIPTSPICSNKIGVKVETIKSTPLKAAPNGFEPTSPEARAAIESIIKDSYAWFRGLVQDRRHLNDDELQTVADGRIFTGHQGIGLKLVDELGDERTGIAWLAKEKNVNAKLPVRDYQLHTRFSDLPFLHAVAAAALDAAGLATLARSLNEWGAMQAVERLNLDGLLALWHPAGAN